MPARAISIVIPVYNEKNAIAETVQEVLDVMGASKIRHEVIVVNDGSTDGTLEILNELCSRGFTKGRLIVASHAFNKGYGAALKTGIQMARYDAVCITDADATYPNRRIPDLYREYEKGFDMVVGQRAFRKLPLITRPAKWFITWLANFLVGERIRDINSGFRIFRKDLAMKFFPIICDGFSFTTTITLAMMTNNYRIAYLPIEYMKREGKSKIKPIRDTLNFIQLIIRTVLYFNPLKVFLPLSIAMFAVCVAIYVIGKMGYFFEKVPTQIIIILFVSGVQILVTGMLADLVDKRIQK